MNGFNSETRNLNKKIVQLTHSELDVKNKKPLNKKKNEREFLKDIWRIKKENCTLNITWEVLKNIKYSIHRDKYTTFTLTENLRLFSSKNAIYSINN